MECCASGRQQCDAEAQPLLVSQPGFLGLFSPLPRSPKLRGTDGASRGGLAAGSTDGAGACPRLSLETDETQPLKGAGEQCKKLRQKLARGKEREGGSLHPAATASLLPLRHVQLGTIWSLHLSDGEPRQVTCPKSHSE